MSVAVHCKERRNCDNEKMGSIYIKISFMMNVKDIIEMVLVSYNLDWIWTWTEEQFSQKCVTVRGT